MDVRNETKRKNLFSLHFRVIPKEEFKLGWEKRRFLKMDFIDYLRGYKCFMFD